MAAPVCPDGSSVVTTVYSEAPNLVVAELDLPPQGFLAPARILKNDNLYAHLGVLLVAPEGDLPQIAANGDCLFDDFISAGPFHEAQASRLKPPA